MISLSDSFATVVPIGNSLSASSRGRGCARFREGEFDAVDAVMFLSRNGTQGEAGVGLKPLSVPKFRMLLFA